MTSDEQYPRSGLLAEPSWLVPRLDDPRVRIIDCGEATAAYARAHVPGAVSLLEHATEDLVAGGPWLKDPADPLHVLGAERLAALMGTLGVSNETTVVAYDDYNGIFATRLWWVLSYFGHRDVRVLNGGWQRWLEEGHPVTFRPAIPEPAVFTPHPDERLLMRLDDLKHRYDDPALQVMNVLWPEHYDGSANPFENPRVGHIPGSVNVPIERFLADETVPRLASATTIRAVLDEAGLRPDRETVVHCQAGVRTTMGVFVLALLGWDRVRAFDGSMAEWSRDQDAPLADPVSPR